MSLNPTVISDTWIAPAAFSDHANANVALGSGAGRFVFALALMDRDSSTSEPQSCRVGSTAGAGGVLCTAGAMNAMFGGTSHNSSRLFWLDSAAIDAAGAALTGTKEVWCAHADGNAKPGLRIIVIQDPSGRAITPGDIGVTSLQAGSGAVTQAVGAPSVEAIGLVFVRNNGATVATASAGSSLLVPGQTDGVVNTVDVIAKPGTGAALSVGWVPGDNFQWQARHFLSLTAAAGGGGTAIGQALEIDSALAMRAALRQTLGIATETDIAQAVSLLALAGFDLHSLPGLVFGDLVGALTALNRQSAVDLKLRVYSVASGALVHESATLTTNGAGRLARYAHAALGAVGTSYYLAFIRVSDGEIVATGPVATT